MTDIHYESKQYKYKGVMMKKEYDFSKGKKNPYAKHLKKQVTIRIDQETIDYFKKLSEENDLPYQILINLYLRDCAENHKKMQIKWSGNK